MKFLIGRLFRGEGGSGFSLGESALEFGLGGAHFGGVDNGDGAGGDNWSGSNWDVSSGDPESVDGVGNVVDALEETVGIDVAVRTAGDTVWGVDFLLGGVDVLVAVVEGSELVLAVVLDGGGGGDDWDGSGGGKSQGSGDSDGSSLNLVDEGGSLNLGEERSGNCADEVRARGLGQVWGVGDEEGSLVGGDHSEGGGCGQECWAFWEGDGLKRCQRNSVVGLDGRGQNGFQDSTKYDLQFEFLFFLL